MYLILTLKSIDFKHVFLKCLTVDLIPLKYGLVIFFTHSTYIVFLLKITPFKSMGTHTLSFLARV